MGYTCKCHSIQGLNLHEHNERIPNYKCNIYMYIYTAHGSCAFEFSCRMDHEHDIYMYIHALFTLILEKGVEKV